VALSDAASEAVRSCRDLGPLIGFRLAGLRGRSRLAAPVAVAVIALVTVAVAVVPALAGGSASRRDVLLLLPSAYLSVLIVSVVSAATSGGGRELLPRDQGVAYPVSPTTDHLGALLMAPLNIAWLLECWAVLGGTSYAVGRHPSLPFALLVVVAWLAAATALAQLVAWAVEWVRRGRHGAAVVRGSGLALLAGAAALAVTDRLVPAFDRSPSVAIAVAVVDVRAGRWGAWLEVVLLLVCLAGAGVVVGAWLAGRVARRPARDEWRVESSRHEPRPHPASDLAALVRTDRASIWRSVPMRRGLVVLTTFPGLVALVGSPRWDMLAVFPGLVASGGALLFGVNSWCLDGRGALWRESLPVSSRLAFVSRALVLLEIMLVAITSTMVLASLRAGAPTTSQVVAVGCAALVVSAQVVSASLRWSVRHPYAVDLRSARATPAPPLVMVGYSARLALVTTLTGLVFNVTGRLPWAWSLVPAVPLLAWAVLTLLRTAAAWDVPEQRARVVTTVAV
jgi:hypothetical protein